jgi:hypothetical protein
MMACQEVLHYPPFSKGGDVCLLVGGGDLKAIF